MHVFLGVVVVLLNLADNATTFWCLREPVQGFEISEANPFARWLFGALGLGPGLAAEMLVTSAAVAFLVCTTRLARRPKLLLLTLLAVLPAWATLNNLYVMHATQIAIAWS